jgi:hypothetical protein
LNAPSPGSRRHDTPAASFDTVLTEDSVTEWSSEA